MFKFIEHTADMGLEARAATREALAEEMARGLACLLFGHAPAAAAEESSIELSAGEPVELLVAWLNEVLYWCERENRVPARFQVECFDGRRLRATVAGEPFAPGKHGIERQVKAVTYHQASLEACTGGWHARVFVDL